jgi:hypothetical protein
LQPFVLPTGWEVLRGIAESAGYRAEPSRAGRRAVVVLRLLSSVFGLDVLRSRLVFNLLNELRVIVTRQAVQDAVNRAATALTSELADRLAASFDEPQFWQGQYDRQHFNWGQLKDRLGHLEAARSVVEWLVQNRVLLRGYRFICPECALRRWHPVDRIQERIVCDGCFESVPAPVGIDVLQWEYRLNEAVALAVDQGVLPHLLAAAVVADWSLYSTEPAMLGLYPGVLLTPVPGSPHPPAEVDLIAFLMGRPIVAEMKNTGSALTKHDVDKLTAIGSALNCSRGSTACECGDLK